MTVNQVVEPFGLCGLGAQHASGHGAQLCGKVLLAQALERSGRNVTHRNAGRELGGFTASAQDVATMLWKD